jgi:hypothetical protein
MLGFVIRFLNHSLVLAPIVVLSFIASYNWAMAVEQRGLVQVARDLEQSMNDGANAVAAGQAFMACASTFGADAKECRPLLDAFDKALGF